MHQDPARAATVSDGLNRMIDIAMSHLGEAYLAAKEQIITQQQEAIRELSVPVLQIRDQMLVLPVVGLIDSARARHLIESLLMAIRDHRAKGVVVTGLLYVSEDASDLHDAQETVDTPLNQLADADLVPGSAALAGINASLR